MVKCGLVEVGGRIGQPTLACNTWNKHPGEPTIKPTPTPATISVQIAELTTKVDQIQQALTLAVSDHDALTVLMVSYIRTNSPIAARIYEHFNPTFGQEVVCGIFGTLRQQGWIRGEKQGIATFFRVVNSELPDHLRIRGIDDSDGIPSWD